MEFLPFILAALVGTAVSVVSYLFARRAGLGPVQAQYIKTLEGSNDALSDRVGQLEGAVRREKNARALLARKVVRLERTVVALAEENDFLRRRLNMPARSEDARIREAIHEEGVGLEDELSDPDLGVHE